MSTENVMVAVDEGGPGHDMSVEVTAKYRADGGIDILSVREYPQAVPSVEFPATGRCDYGHGCSRIGPLRQVAAWLKPPVPLYGCRWHVAAATRARRKAK